MPTIVIGLYWLGLFHAIQNGSFSTLKVAARGGVSLVESGLMLVFLLNVIPVGLMLYASFSAARERIFPPRPLARGRVFELRQPLAYALSVTFAACAVALAYLPIAWFLGVRADLALLGP